MGSRLRGMGILKPDQAVLLGAVGPMARASGLAYDARKLGYAAYDELDFEPVTAQDGDSYARCQVRIEEIYQSFALIRQAVGKMPNGPIQAVSYTHLSRSQGMSSSRQPMGIPL